MSCEYYGRTAHRLVRQLVTQGGNQCPVVLHKFAACEMELAGHAPDQNTCPLYKIGLSIFAGWEMREFIPLKPPPADLVTTPGNTGPYGVVPLTEDERTQHQAKYPAAGYICRITGPFIDYVFFGFSDQCAADQVQALNLAYRAGQRHPTQ